MELEYVDRLPPRARHTKKTRHDLWDFLMTFLESEREFARIKLEPGEYVSSTTCLAAFSNAIPRYQIEGVRAVVREDSVYLVRE